MPNEKVLNEKMSVVEELVEKLSSLAGVFVDYSGINVNDDTEMRVKMREANVQYTVIKNTLMRFAINKVGLEELDPILNGTTSLAISNDDPIAPARVVKEFADKFQGYFEIKGGFMDGKVLSIEEVLTMALIPPLKTLQAQLLGTMLAPIASLAMVVGAAAEKDNNEDSNSQPDEATAVNEDETTAEATEETAEEATAEATAEATEEVASEAEAEEDAQETTEQAEVEATAEDNVAAEANADDTAEETTEESDTSDDDTENEDNAEDSSEE
ncbi:MAG: 50S ribosomal protein L10 [Oscillospiraceae bacterium]|nr:50S ribosomal protein L10 [Oscillospiraceae bacterium]